MTRPAARPARNGSNPRGAANPVSTPHNTSSTTVISRPMNRRYKVKNAPHAAPNAIAPMTDHTATATRSDVFVVGAPKTLRATPWEIAKRTTMATSITTTTSVARSVSGPRARPSAVTAIVTAGDAPTSSIDVRVAAAIRSPPVRVGATGSRGHTRYRPRARVIHAPIIVNPLSVAIAVRR